MKKSDLIARALGLSLCSAGLAVLAGLPLQASAANLANGQKLYLQHCAGCHGDKGLANMPNTPNFARGERLQQPDPMLVDSVRLGKGAMPAFVGIIKDNEFYDVIAYVRSLRY